MNVKPGIYYADGSFEELELDEGTNALPVFKQLQKYNIRSYRKSL